MEQNTIKWLVEYHVVSTKIYAWDAEGLAEDILQVTQMVNQSDLPLVHSVWDFRDLETYPTNLNDIRKAVQPLFTHEQCGWVITIIQNQMIGFLAQAGSSMYGVRYRSFKTMEEAKQFLQKQDPTLPPL